MSALLDARGREVPEPEGLSRCPACAGDKLERTNSFGGFWKVVCCECGHTLAQGRK